MWFGLGIGIFLEWCRGEGEVSPCALGQELLLMDGTRKWLGRVLQRNRPRDAIHYMTMLDLQ